MPTVETLQQRLKQNVDESITGTYPSDAECLAWFNEAQDFIAEDLECLTESVSATMDVSAATTIATPSDWLRGKAFVWSTNTFLTYVEIDFLLENGYTITTTGVPAYWYVYDGYIRFYPVPSADTAYNYYYYRLPTELTAISSTPEIPVQWHSLLPVWGAYRFWQKEEEPTNAAMFLGEFGDRLRKAKVTQHKRAGRRGHRVRDVTGLG